MLLCAPNWLAPYQHRVLRHALDVVQIEVADVFLVIVVIVFLLVVVVVIFLVSVVIIVSLTSSSSSLSLTGGDTMGTYPSMVGAGTAFKSFCSSSDSI